MVLGLAFGGHTGGVGCREETEERRLRRGAPGSSAQPM